MSHSILKFLLLDEFFSNHCDRTDQSDQIWKTSTWNTASKILLTNLELYIYIYILHLLFTSYLFYSDQWFVQRELRVFCWIDATNKILTFEADKTHQNVPSIILCLGKDNFLEHLHFFSFFLFFVFVCMCVCVRKWIWSFRNTFFNLLAWEDDARRLKNESWLQPQKWPTNSTKEVQFQQKLSNFSKQPMWKSNSKTI